ncbi:uncharacterized protein F5891DRAFT_985469 [Suillus fuscotomentosus]|uniref:HAT C-terminal dimerisation domain-containing protein n=1 Tax=Suillus fuscotomentosus TaxID=1912939 RepID=A0AAD4HEP0_9AGAM|nr:uncharacterized protein F5891DRAFT_985469 [Suillus fuscotomentosus]KAG1893833.1 hypothetical protein F5891DRAFT_985469 [Suillus fuscotomentosus]
MYLIGTHVSVSGNRTETFICVGARLYTLRAQYQLSLMPAPSPLVLALSIQHLMPCHWLSWSSLTRMIRIVLPWSSPELWFEPDQRLCCLGWFFIGSEPVLNGSEPHVVSIFSDVKMSSAVRLTNAKYNRSLKDASEITFYHDADNDIPLPPSEACYRDTWMREAITARQNNNANHAHNPCNELTAYLTSPLDKVVDIVVWWGYPTLACIARDYLPIQESAVLSEQAFSSGGITSTICLHVRTLIEPDTTVLNCSHWFGSVFNDMPWTGRSARFGQQQAIQQILAGETKIKTVAFDSMFFSSQG